MGLDAVEIVMEVEDRFRISIPDSMASEMRTVGELSDYVEREVAGATGGCWSRRVFYRVRSALVEVVGAEVGKVGPGDALEDVLPRQGRRVAWARLAERSGYRLPGLVRPAWLATALVGVPVAALVTGVVLGRGGGWAILAAIAWPLVAVPLTVPQAKRLPADVQTIRDLVHSVVARNRVEGDGTASLGREEVWQIVQRIVAEQMGVEVKRVERGSRFVEDLGVG